MLTFKERTWTFLHVLLTGDSRSCWRGKCHSSRFLHAGDSSHVWLWHTGDRHLCFYYFFIWAPDAGIGFPRDYFPTRCV